MGRDVSGLEVEGSFGRVGISFLCYEKIDDSWGVVVWGCAGGGGSGEGAGVGVFADELGGGGSAGEWVFDGVHGGLGGRGIAGSATGA